MSSIVKNSLQHFQPKNCYRYCHSLMIIAWAFLVVLDYRDCIVCPSTSIFFPSTIGQTTYSLENFLGVKVLLKSVRFLLLYVIVHIFIFRGNDDNRAHVHGFETFISLKRYIAFT